MALGKINIESPLPLPPTTTGESSQKDPQTYLEQGLLSRGRGQERAGERSVIQVLVVLSVVAK